MKKYTAFTFVGALLFLVVINTEVANAQIYDPYYGYNSYNPYTPYTTPTFNTTLFARDLTIGSTGNDVSLLQTFLEGRSFLVMPYGVAKGYFGTLTQSALARYQASVGVYPATGYFDWATRARVSTDYYSYTPPVFSTNPYNPYTPTYQTYPYTAASIRVTQPNSGEVYRPGDIIEIRWDASGLVNRPFSVCLTNYRDECFRTIASIPADSYDRRNYTTSWYVGDNMPTGDYRITVSSVDAAGIRVVDQSDNVFRITSSRNSLRIVPDTLAEARVDTYYSQTIRIDNQDNYCYDNYNYSYNYNDNYYNNYNYCNDTNLEWRIVSGSLPPGLNFERNSNEARIVGRAYSTGTYSFTVEVNDRYRSNSQSYSITVR